MGLRQETMKEVEGARWERRCRVSGKGEDVLCKVLEEKRRREEEKNERGTTERQTSAATEARSRRRNSGDGILDSGDGVLR